MVRLAKMTMSPPSLARSAWSRDVIATRGTTSVVSCHGLSADTSRLSLTTNLGTVSYRRLNSRLIELTAWLVGSSGASAIVGQYELNISKDLRPRRIVPADRIRSRL